MIKSSQVKSYFKEKGYRTSKDFVEALEKSVLAAMDAAATKAEADKRKTVKPEDL